MGQVLHGSATTTEAIRRAIQHSQESLRGLAKRYGINPKTVAKWRKRSSVALAEAAIPRARVAWAHASIHDVQLQRPEWLAGEIAAFAHAL